MTKRTVAAAERWVLVNPKGEMQLEVLCSSEKVARAAAADDAKQWRQLKAAGWQIVKVRIAQVIDDAEGAEK